MRCTRWVGGAALIVALALALVACGDDTSDEEKVADRLDQALTDHAEGRVDDARKGYQDVLDTDPGNQYAHYNLGLLHQQAGENAEAEREYRAAIRTDANFASALFNLAILRTEADPDEAEDLYRSVLTVQPDNGSAHLNLGFLLIDQGEATDGQRELDKAVDLDPSLASRIPDQDADEPDTPTDEAPSTTVP